MANRKLLVNMAEQKRVTSWRRKGRETPEIDFGKMKTML